jgi:hypothetical protein
MSSQVTNKALLLSKYSGDGSLVWTRTQGSSGNVWAQSIAIDPVHGDVFVAGGSDSALDGQVYYGETDCVILKYLSDGSRAWISQSGTPGFDAGNNVFVDLTGIIYLLVNSFVYII